MSAPAQRTIADLDVSVDVLLAEIAAAHDSQEELAYREALHLVQHPEGCSTGADYPGWVPPHSTLGGAL
jgi:hypothetical protein